MDFSRKDFKNLLDQTIRQLKRGVNKTVLKLPEIEQKVLDATCNEPWGPHGSALAEIARASRNHDDYVVIMACLWKRLASRGKNWRHVYKALTVLEYLVANGSEQILIDVWEHMDELQALSTDFEYIEPPPPHEKDQGLNVRKKAEMLVALLHDKNRVAELRHKAAANRHKYYGIASSSLSSCFSQQGEGLSKFPHECSMPAPIVMNDNLKGDKRESGTRTRRGSAPPTYDESLNINESSVLSPAVKMYARRESAPSSFQESMDPLSKKKVEIVGQCPSKRTTWHRDQFGRSTSLPSSVVTTGDVVYRDKYGRSASVSAMNGKKKPLHVPCFDDIDDGDQFDPCK
ncbi:hypothetical protein GOP47_0029266 [Adiantum capillus-veneris]|nr:hypothetical protein GOP47_0029266 [Adiantum capillus-veneris]